MTLIALLSLGACGDSVQPLNTASPASLRFPAPPADALRAALPGRSLLIHGATVIDGRGGPPQEGMDVRVEAGVIEEIGVGLTAPELPHLDATGLFLLPGLITSHSHVQSVPGSILRGDSAEDIEQQQTLQLRAYLASGFTTLLDPAIGTETAARLRAHVDAGHPGPEIAVLAPFITPAGGYMTTAEMRGKAFDEFWPAVDAATDLDALFAQAEPLDPVGAKVALEDGVVFANLATFDDASLDRIREAGQRAGQPLFVHSIRNEDHRRALELDPYALVHMGLWDETIAPDVLAELTRRGTYVITTVTLNHLAAWGWHRAFEDDPWIRQRVPIVQWETATHPDEPKRLSHLTSEIMRPSWVPGGLARVSAPMFTPSLADAAEATASGTAAVQALEAAGVPWVVGADEGNSPAYTTFFHGVSSQIELEQLEAGGLSPAAILQACTRRPAEMLGVLDRLGTIEVGKQADLILVAANPLEDGMVALRTLQWTIQRGSARTPASWLVDP